MCTLRAALEGASAQVAAEFVAGNEAAAHVADGDAAATRVAETMHAALTANAQTPMLDSRDVLEGAVAWEALGAIGLLIEGCATASMDHLLSADRWRLEALIRQPMPAEVDMLEATCRGSQTH